MLAPVTFDATIRLRTETEPGASLVLALLPARTHHQQLSAERLRVLGAIAQSVFTEADSATRYLYLTARGGPLEVELSASVRLLQAEPAPGRLHLEAPEAPLSTPESLRALRPSRWCPSDRLAALVAEEFAQVDPPYERALAIDRWVRRHLRVLPPESPESPESPDGAAAATPGRGAIDALARGAGTPRELAHLAIALCRAARLPARFVTTVPFGIDDAADLHPWVEVLAGDAWIAFDPSRRVPRTALLRWGTGRDAADVPLVIAHGDATPPRIELSVRADVPADVLRERDLAAGAVCAATPGSLAEATRWHQEARLAARRPPPAVEPTRPAPSRVAAAAARAASNTPRAVAPVRVFPAPTGSRPPCDASESGCEPVRPGGRDARVPPFPPSVPTA